MMSSSIWSLNFPSASEIPIYLLLRERGPIPCSISIFSAASDSISRQRFRAFCYNMCKNPVQSCDQLISENVIHILHLIQ